MAVVDTANYKPVLSGMAQRLYTSDPIISWASHDGETHLEPNAGHVAAIEHVAKHLTASGHLSRIAAVGHRVVHGGTKITSAVLVDHDVEETIEECASLAPLHNPPGLAGIRACLDLLPSLPQVAVFDTAFHQTLPQRAYRYAVPNSWLESHGVRKYGFHGTSVRYVANTAIKQLALDPADSGLIVAHLGNGCSATAVHNGKSVDTTMGLTPLEGLVMGTRSGDIDPAVVSYMAKSLNRSAAEVVNTLNTKSGLLGLSGISSDMRQHPARGRQWECQGGGHS